MASRDRLLHRWKLAPYHARLSIRTWRNSAVRGMHHEERIDPGSKGALPGVWGTRILRVARESNGAEEVGAQRRLRHVQWDWQGSVILVGEWKERSFSCRGSESESPLALLIAPDGAQEVDAPEGGPVCVAEVVLTIGALPKQEAA